MNCDALARALLRRLRGRRSQRAWSFRLGYTSNVAYAWESGRRWPSAAEFLRAAEVSGRDPRAAQRAFLHPSLRQELEGKDACSAEGVALFMRLLRGGRSIQSLASHCSVSRSALSRWLSGQTAPRLPQFLRFVEASSLRLLDWISAFVDPATLEICREEWGYLCARRQGASRHPWTQAILRALELQDYRALPAHRPGWLSQRLLLPDGEESRCLEYLEESGQIRWDGTHYEQQTMAVDTRSNPQLSARLKAHWTRCGAERIEAGSPGQFSYNVFGISRRDFERIRALHLAYYHQLRSIVAQSAPVEQVAVVNIQLFTLDSAAQD